LPGADRFVARINHGSPGVSGNHIGYSVQGAVDRIQTPKATTGENKRAHVKRLV